ncbi:hypothetical protein EDEG_00011 [Edhazardia aedis USNM 41457]|uniref:Uncharacterized protein n=1 Tax=Edhazardia aedis (strain USNM 41457) TaxID=1003232 RepID=J9D5T8_EDHAE|nr:hypothetical protein EDEG_00011 [Edhazardia aedis USNM 41457]|eukprot:EJW03141.1 hypothetical protein EDEG_00011 [Edhazardia aedis USNM 41457]
MLNIVNENIDSEAIHSMTIQNEKFIACLMLTIVEKGEIEEKVLVNIRSDQRTKENELVDMEKILTNLIDNLLTDSMEKTKIVMNIFIMALEEDYNKNIFADLINGTSYCLLLSGIPIKDVLCAISAEEVKLAYLIHENTVAYLDKSGKFEDVSGTVNDIFGAIDACIEKGNMLKDLVSKKIFG